MKHLPIYVGDNLIGTDRKEVAGEFLDLDGERFYRIANYDQMRPFFMSIVSDSDHWMFISSSGGLTAGRRNAENALFPYYTDDKIHQSGDVTGSKTLILVEKSGRKCLWEPFSDRHTGVYNTERNLYKSLYGNKLLFEEINHDLGLTFRYAWGNSEQFGFVKRASLINDGKETSVVDVLDGIQNLLPSGVEQAMQANFSTLLDAYKKNELEQTAGLGIYSLSSLVVDKAEPSESLKATTVWSAGIQPRRYLLSSLQLDQFRQGGLLESEIDVRAECGAYFIQAKFELGSAREKAWYLVAEVNQDARSVQHLINQLSDQNSLIALLEEDVRRGTEHLESIVATSDGLQRTGDNMVNARHYGNVLFNVMRGGVLHDNGQVSSADLQAFVAYYNKPVATEQAAFFEGLPASATIADILARAGATGDHQLLRLCYEYLPITFSRRHGDPSRPWNKFSIDIRNNDGSVALNYEGNWRDIFQNWEALACSFPEFVESMICKFVNASTPDGYNPYRISRDGIDWEVIDPSDPWSNIGYWGDHQVIYLLKLLELSHNHHPDAIASFLTKDMFAYANVPYRIKTYNSLLQDPHNTILFDQELNTLIADRVAETGADGKLVWGGNARVYHVNLTEKLLALVLSKMSNFIPEGGIWMNTQRPEWNDANNALVGFGISLVTLGYLRRFVEFMRELFASVSFDSVSISEELVDLFEQLHAGLLRFVQDLENKLSETKRKEMLDCFGSAGSDFREKIYNQGGFSGQKSSISIEDLASFLDTTLMHLDHSLKANQRSDRLFHAYNLMSNGSKGISVMHLYEMLEGQVAVLSSGALDARSAVEVLDALKTSAIYREDQFSYMLYPDRELRRFVEKNHISLKQLEGSQLISQLEATDNEELLFRGANGSYHFNGSIRNKESIEAVLDDLSNRGYTEAVRHDRSMILDAFEQEFDHRSYTGRSGTFYGYEGLGSIYWHMVSKLVLAIQETYIEAHRSNADPTILGRLADHYFEARAGIGLNKSPELYGAFPFDPYSHTPGNAGVQQPGLTGQVKEDILSRWGELGIQIRKGAICFEPIMLKKEEFLSESTVFKYYDVNGRPQVAQLERDMLGFTYCQVPVLYNLSVTPGITVTYKNGETASFNKLALDVITSQQIFKRSGQIQQVSVDLMPAL